MAKNAWQERIHRAENLANQYPFAVEILGFYVHVARFQQDLHQRIERSAGVPPASMPALFTSLLSLQDAGATFLALVEDRAPARLAEIASELRSASAAWSDLLNKVWSTTEPPSKPEEFLAFAFLQPYAEYVRSDSRPQLEGYALSLCPLCKRKPALGVLRQQGDGARRSLVCGFCVTEWEFRRIVCPGCDQEDHAKLPVYTAESIPHIRVECCDACHTYIKSIDLTKNGLANPLVDELASVPLNLWAQERRYSKLHPNLLGM